MEELGNDDKCMLLKFTTGGSCVPLEGFKKLPGGKFTISQHRTSMNALPTASTCFNTLQLPSYTTYDILKKRALVAIRHGSDGFAFA